MAEKMDEELEYHVTFPTPTPGDDVEEFTEFLEGALRKTETAVLLVGWLDSQDKHLAKYSQFWADKGCTTVRYSPRKMDMMGARQEIVAKKLLEVLLEMNLAENPVLMHIFSNGGGRIYHAMEKQLKSNAEFEDIQKLGVIFDSCPSRPRLSSKVNVLFARFPQNFITTILKGVAYGFGSLLVGVDYIANLFGLSIAPTTVYDELTYLQADCPELYLYTKADKVITPSDVQHLIEKRKMQSVDITTTCWEDGEHVALLQSHREGYINQCYIFLAKCLNRAANLLQS